MTARTSTFDLDNFYRSSLKNLGGAQFNLETPPPSPVVSSNHPHIYQNVLLGQHGFGMVPGQFAKKKEEVWLGRLKRPQSALNVRKSRPT